MTDELALLRDARPHAAGPSPELAGATRRQVMGEIAFEAGGRRTIRRRAVVLVAAAAVAVATALVGVTSLDRGGAAWAAAVVRVAETSPRLLVDAPGWSVTRADEFAVGYGEMTFSDGERQLELHWQRDVDLGAKLDDPGSGLDSLGTTIVQGTPARLFRYSGSTDFAAVWSQGGYGLEARGVAPDLATFTALVGTLHEVSVDTWLSAMPQSVVKPDGRSKVVLEMLDGVPLPPRFDVAPLLRGERGAVLDRYQLGAQVTGAVACAWLDRLVAARRAGDDAALRQAVGALATSHDWKALREMAAIGDYPRVLWEYADAAATNAPIAAGKELTVAESYRDALGCPAR